MKFSKAWLQEYINEQLPDDGTIVSALNRKAFEVEEVIILEDDTIFDIKVLPNRAHDALGHHGMAYELCASLALTFNKEKDIAEDLGYINGNIPKVAVNIEDTATCTRFMSVQIDGVQVGESPLWLKKKLEAIGQRSINNIVDITNYVQFALNKPMHAYDARAIKGALTVRFAKEGETLVTLDDKELVLDEATLVIADDLPAGQAGGKVLGLAGIKGGKHSGINETTTSVILESANFNPTLIRKTAEKYGLKTDASKRFENGIANNLIIEGLHMTANTIHALFPAAKKGEVTDVYPKKDVPYYVGISLNEVNSILGATYDEATIETTLAQLSFPYEILTPREYIEKTYPTLLGAGYKNPSSMREDAPHVFSCSSLISYLYKGVWMPSLSIDKYVFTERIQEEGRKFGDLIFANSGEGKIRFETVEFLKGTQVPAGVDHVGIYVGNDEVVHATKVKGMVVKETFSDFKVGRSITGWGRVLPDLEEKRYVVRVPSVRLDIRIKEDLAEEIGRIIGYETLSKTLPELKRIGLLHKRAYYENKVREVLVAEGFSEVITYTFGNSGVVRLKKGLAGDKELLRDSLSHGLLESYTKNLYNAPLIGITTVKMFEFGNVFKEGSELRELGIVFDDGGKKTNFAQEVEGIFSKLAEALTLSSIEYTTASVKPYTAIINFDKLISSLSEKDEYLPLSVASSLPSYTPVSVYPFIVRDIALWTPEGTSWEAVEQKLLSEKDVRIVRVQCFDTFTKTFEDGTKKTSYAFRLVIQSYEATLTDEEANAIAKVVYDKAVSAGYEIR